jgi:hypothetical protein
MHHWLIQQINLFADSKWAIICFSEAQLLSFLADLEMDQAMIWNETDPNTLCKDKCLIFPILTRAAYESTLKCNGNIKSPLEKLLSGYLPMFRRLQLKLNFCKQLFQKANYIAPSYSI